MPDRGLVLYVTLETLGLVAILLPGLMTFLTRPKGKPGAR
ncbi:hypothetical protein SAJA_08330 [Salinisphaera japonica YTM-1]|uniref:Uncharacterized protein n=1 Tax=Salinisphaera japonica YTM-1 TaxID=1209778 RepID=A0A423PRD6_9GAMM|nr:hypothetical protein SAJA_08330 [Salinisphaera japonica YTM-1]